MEQLGVIRVAAVPDPDVLLGVIVLQTGAWLDPADHGGRVVDEGSKPTP